MEARFFLVGPSRQLLVVYTNICSRSLFTKFNWLSILVANPIIYCYSIQSLQHLPTHNEEIWIFCEKLKPLRFKLIFSMTQVTQSTNPSTMCTNTLKTKKLQLPNHVRFTSLFEKPLASLGQSALLLGTHGAVSYPDLRSAARTKHKARPV